MKYSNSGTITKLINGREYQARKMGAMSVAKEGFKLLMALTPSMGAGIDALRAEQEREEMFLDGQSHTFGAMLQLLSENITEEHFEDLTMKLMGSLYLGEEKITDLDKHFSQYEGDFIDVLVWLFRETFTNFIMESAIVVSWIEKMSALLSPKMKEIVSDWKKTLETESKEK